MLPRAARLHTKAEFAAATHGGRRAGGPALVAHLRVCTARGTRARVGFVVSRAVGSAVVRNRVRRRLQALMRERLSRLPAGALLVVRAQPAAAAMNFAELAGELDRVLGRVMSRNSRGRAA